MSFNIDRQTLDELNLLGKFRQGSVYGLFNQVKTRGGEQLLDHLFHHPLEEARAINERSAIFQFFQEARLSFPFDPQEVSLVREYLDSGARKSALLTLIQTLIKKGLSGLIRDERYKKDVQGLQATIGVMKNCYAMVELLGSMTGPYGARIKAIRGILSDKRLERLGKVDIYKALARPGLCLCPCVAVGKEHPVRRRSLSSMYRRGRGQFPLAAAGAQCAVPDGCEYGGEVDPDEIHGHRPIPRAHGLSRSGDEPGIFRPGRPVFFDQRGG